MRGESFRNRIKITIFYLNIKCDYNNVVPVKYVIVPSILFSHSGCSTQQIHSFGVYITSHSWQEHQNVLSSCLDTFWLKP